MCKSVYSLSSFKFCRAFWITMRPYLLFVSCVAGMVGFAAGPEIGIIGMRDIINKPLSPEGVVSLFLVGTSDIKL